MPKVQVSIATLKSFQKWYSLLFSDGFAVIVVAAAAFTDTFMYDAAVPFLPQMLRKRLGIPDDQIQWWTSVVLAVFGGASLISTACVALVTDSLRSKKLPFFAGLVVMTASTFMFFLGESVSLLVSSRALQGLSTALVWVSGLAFLTSHVDASFVGTAMGYVTLGLSMGELIGPLTGGVLYELAGHEGVMYLTLVLLAIDGILRCLLRDKPEGMRREYIRETEPLLDGATCQDNANYGRLSEHAHHDFLNKSSTRQNSESAVKINRGEYYRDIASSWWAIFTLGIIRTGLEATLPRFVEHQFGWSTSASGAIMFAVLLPTVSSPLVAKWANNHGPRWASVVYFIVAVAASCVLAFLQGTQTVVQVGFVLTIMVIGTCMAVVTTVHTVAFGWASKKAELEGDAAGGMLFGSMSIAWGAATLVGPLLADAMLESLGWGAFNFLLAGLSLLGAIVSSFCWRRWEVLE